MSIRGPISLAQDSSVFSHRVFQEPTPMPSAEPEASSKMAAVLSHSPGATSYSEATFLNGGNLVVTTSSLPGDAHLNAGTLLTFNQSEGGFYSGRLSGSGAVRKDGTSTITFTGNHSHIGGTFVEEGTLILAGSTLGPLDVLSRGTLSGGGTIGGDVIVRPNRHASTVSLIYAAI